MAVPQLFKLVNRGVLEFTLPCKVFAAEDGAHILGAFGPMQTEQDIGPQWQQ